MNINRALFEYDRCFYRLEVARCYLTIAARYSRFDRGLISANPPCKGMAPVT